MQLPALLLSVTNSGTLKGSTEIVKDGVEFVKEHPWETLETASDATALVTMGPAGLGAKKIAFESIKQTAKEIGPAVVRFLAKRSLKANGVQKISSPPSGKIIEHSILSESTVTSPQTVTKSTQKSDISTVSKRSETSGITLSGKNARVRDILGGNGENISAEDFQLQLQAEQALDAHAKKDSTTTPLLPNEGKVGSYGELKKLSKNERFNLHAHHGPNDLYMSNLGVSKQDGISILVRNTLHREIHKKLRIQDPTLSPRSALAQSILRTREVYKEHDLYLPQMRSGLQDKITKSKETHPDLFEK